MTHPPEYFFGGNSGHPQDSLWPWGNRQAFDLGEKTRRGFFDDFPPLGNSGDCFVISGSPVQVRQSAPFHPPPSLLMTTHTTTHNPPQLC
jgi:hypothetical protein